MQIFSRGGSNWFADTERRPGDTLIASVEFVNGTPDLENIIWADHPPSPQTSFYDAGMIKSALAQTRPVEKRLGTHRADGTMIPSVSN